MKKIYLLFCLIILSFFAQAQNTVTLESGTSLITPQFRYKAITPDSLNHLWIYNPTTGKYNRIATMTEANLLYAPITGGGYKPKNDTVNAQGYARNWQLTNLLSNKLNRNGSNANSDIQIYNNLYKTQKGFLTDTTFADGSQYYYENNKTEVLTEYFKSGSYDAVNYTWHDGALMSLGKTVLGTVYNYNLNIQNNRIGVDFTKGGKPVYMAIDSTGKFTIRDSVNRRGPVGYDYYGANYTDNTYTQKKYIVDNYIPKNTTTTASVGYSYNIDGSANIGGKLGTGFATVPGSQLESYSSTNPLFTARNSTTASVELITATNDRTFAGSNNWTGTNWSTSGGTFLHATGSSVSATLLNTYLTAGSIVSGRQYIVTITVNWAGAGTLTVGLGGSVTSTGISSATLPSTISLLVTAGSNNADLTVNTGSTFTGSFTNISVKQVQSSFNIGQDNSVYINSNANALSDRNNLFNINKVIVGQGTISVTASGTTVTGTNTNFDLDFNLGDAITANGETHTITAVTRNSLTTDAWTNTYSGSYNLTPNPVFSISKKGTLTLTSNNTSIGAIFQNTNVNGAATNGGVTSIVTYTKTDVAASLSLAAYQGTVTIAAANSQNLTNTSTGVAGYLSTVTIQNSASAYTIASASNYNALFTFSATLGTITNGYLFKTQTFSNAGTITNMVGYQTPNFTGGTITNQTHFLAGQATAPTGNWAYYNATANKNYLGTAATLIGSSTDNGLGAISQTTGLATITKMYSGTIGTDSVMLHGSDGKLKVASPNGFILNQQAVGQTANMWITGDIYANTVQVGQGIFSVNLSGSGNQSLSAFNYNSVGRGADISGGNTKATSGYGGAGGAYALKIMDYAQNSITTFYKDEIDFSVPINLKNYTVATLPTGTRGMTAYVTDALAPSYLVAVVGGGAVVTPVFYDGANWVSH